MMHPISPAHSMLNGAAAVLKTKGKKSAFLEISYETFAFN